VSEKEKTREANDRSIDRTSSTTKDEDNLSPLLSLILPKRDPDFWNLVVIKKEGSLSLADERVLDFFLGARGE